MTDQQAQATPKPEKGALRTEYVVLRKLTVPQASSGGISDTNDKTWVEAGTATAVNAQAAIKAAAGKEEGTFIAVPARSWKPLTRKIEKVERDLWS